MKKEDQDLEDLFKESFDNFEADVDSSVWDNVRTGLKWGGIGLFIKLLFNQIGTSTLVALASSAITVVATLFFVNTNNNETPATNNTEPETRQTTNDSTDLIQHDTVYQIVEKVIEVPQVITVDSKQKTSNGLTTQEEKAKLESMIHLSKDRETTSIYASPSSGPVPLIVDLKNQGTGTNPKWIFEDDKKPSFEENPVHIFDTPGTYTIQLNSTNKDGLISKDVVTIEVKGNSSIEQTPRLISFSPNNDGIADVFNLKSKNMAFMNTKIYNNKSKLVYQWEGNDGEWNGKDLNGKDAPVDTYYYIIVAEGVDGKKYDRTGQISLER